MKKKVAGERWNSHKLDSDKYLDGVDELAIPCGKTKGSRCNVWNELYGGVMSGEDAVNRSREFQPSNDEDIE